MGEVMNLNPAGRSPNEDCSLSTITPASASEEFRFFWLPRKRSGRLRIGMGFDGCVREFTTSFHHRPAKLQTSPCWAAVHREIHPIAHHCPRQSTVRLTARRSRLPVASGAEDKGDFGDVRGDRRVGGRIVEEVAVDGRASACPMQPQPLPALLADHVITGERGGSFGLCVGVGGVGRKEGRQPFWYRTSLQPRRREKACAD